MHPNSYESNSLYKKIWFHGVWSALATQAPSPAGHKTFTKLIQELTAEKYQSGEAYEKTPRY